MNNNKIAELRTALILILLLNSFFQVWVIGKETTITSPWLENSVQVDGKITSPDEWKEAIPVDVVIGEYSDGAPYTARLWIKNNELDLYILTRIDQRLVEDGFVDFGILYFWPEWDPAQGWDYSDGSGIIYEPGFTVITDYYGWVDATFSFSVDVDASPPGQNNIMGEATHDGYYYWFEMRKPLDSGDGYDWEFTPGETYGWNENGPGKSDAMMVTFFPSDETSYYTGHFTLTLANKSEDTSGLDPIGFSWSLESITALITIGAAGVGIISWMTRTYRIRRRKKILFARFMRNLDNIYSDFKMNASRRETELQTLNSDVFSEFKQGMLDEGQYNLLFERIEGIIEEIREKD